MSSPEQLVEDTATPEPAARPLRSWVCVLIGMGSAVIGLLPWLITGMRLPVQNLWATDAAPDELPLTLLPFSQYAITLIVALIVTGAAVAGIVARATRSRLPKRGVAAILSGVLVIQVVAAAQTSVLVGAGLQERRESALYLAALIAVVAVSILIGVLVMLLIAKAPKAGAVIGLSIAAVASTSWFSGLVVPFGTIPSVDVTPLLGLVRWVPPILVGAAIAWGGITSVGRIVAAGVGLLALWIGPALITAISNAAGSRVLARDPALMLEYGADVFGMALTMPASRCHRSSSPSPSPRSDSSRARSSRDVARLRRGSSICHDERMTARPPALVGISHGTSSRAGRAAVHRLHEAVAAAMATRHPDAPPSVRLGHVDVEQPDVPSTLASLGPGEPAVVVPLLLSAGYHVHVDLAEAVEQETGQTGRRVVLADALGPDDRLATVLLRRLHRGRPP